MFTPLNASDDETWWTKKGKKWMKADQYSAQLVALTLGSGNTCVGALSRWFTTMIFSEIQVNHSLPASLAAQISWPIYSIFDSSRCDFGDLKLVNTQGQSAKLKGWRTQYCTNYWAPWKCGKFKKGREENIYLSTSLIIKRPIIETLKKLIFFQFKIGMYSGIYFCRDLCFFRWLVTVENAARLGKI